VSSWVGSGTLAKWSIADWDEKRKAKAKKKLTKLGIAVESGWYVLAEDKRNRTFVVDLYSGVKVKLRGHESMYSMLWDSAHGPIVIGGGFGDRRWTITELGHPAERPKRTKAKYLYKAIRAIYRYLDLSGLASPNRLVGSRRPKDSPGSFQFLALEQTAKKRKNMYEEKLLASVSYKSANSDNVWLLGVDEKGEHGYLRDGKYIRRVSFSDGETVDKVIKWPGAEGDKLQRLYSPDGRSIVAEKQTKVKDTYFEEVYRIADFESWFEKL
jgi:hypothetical protein